MNIEDAPEMEETPLSDVLEERAELSPNETAYLLELLPEADCPQNTPALRGECLDALDARIAEIKRYDHPRALDSDANIKKLLTPFHSSLAPELLEAPHDHIQIRDIADTLRSCEGLEYSRWSRLSAEEKARVLNSVEKEIAAIAHRPCQHVSIAEMPPNTYGYFSGERIVINRNLLESSARDKNAYYELLDTLIHEGRHAYQQYNVFAREVHPRQSEVNSWRENWADGYMRPDFARMHGFRLYKYQPVETDARQFAQDVLSRLKQQA